MKSKLQTLRIIAVIGIIFAVAGAARADAVPDWNARSFALPNTTGMAGSNRLRPPQTHALLTGRLPIDTGGGTVVCIPWF